MSSKKSLQRSSSSSCIPVPSRLSRAPVRTSFQNNRGKSLSRPGLEKRSLDRNSRSHSNSNLNDLPRLSRQRSGSLVRQTFSSVTPLHGPRSDRKSPLLSSVRKDNRPISDKRWQYEQLVKVRNFVCGVLNFDHNSVKSGMALDVFITLMQMYFQMIDKRIVITKGNYMEEVPANLKRFRYPAAVKPSLMKTVNTPHSWPHVLAILSWLTDTVNEINAPDEPLSNIEGLVDKCARELYYQWNQNAEDTSTMEFPLQELDSELMELLHVDASAIAKLDHDLEKLRQDKLSYSQRKKNVENDVDVLRSKISTDSEKCERFVTEYRSYERDLSNQQEHYTKRIKALDQEIAELVKTEDQLKQTLAAQPYSVSEKQQLEQEIESLQNTVKLKEERCQQQQELIDKYDFKLSNLKQKMEAAAYKYNNTIRELELETPSYKKLRIRESGFARSDTKDELIEAERLQILTIAKLKEDQKSYNHIIEELDQKEKQLDEKLVVAREELEQLIKSDAELSFNLEHENKKMAAETKKAHAALNKHRDALLQLKNSQIDLTPLKQELTEWCKLQVDLLQFKENLKDSALEFFVKLEAQISNSVQNYMIILNNITDAIAAAEERAIEESEDRVKQLKKLREEENTISSHSVSQPTL